MDIAIIGMAGRFPEANNIEEFRRHLQEGRDSVRPLSRVRLQRTSLSPLAEYEILGYLEDIDLFDHAFFNISLGEAIHMDPHQRIILEVVYQTFENAGYSPDHYAGTHTATFAADVNLEYGRHATAEVPTLTTGNLNAIIAGRIARTFDLRGSAVMIDTSCSSSLVALHYACNAIRLGEVENAIVCAANMKLFPEVPAHKQDIGISSPDGKTRAFSADASGTGTGEAVCCVLLKSYENAIRDGDNIHAIIKGSAVNQDAALSASLTSPSSVAQAEVIRKAWKMSGIDPATITYIEAHGTATKLGDPIEVQGISMAFKEYGCTERSCGIGSVKSNVGHTAAAAGLMGLIKTVLSLKSGQLFPSLHFERPNPFIDFEHSPVYVVDKLSEWRPASGIRRAGVSSFGFSGTNCHVILEEAPMPIPWEGRTAGGNKDHLIVVSGKSRASLHSNIRALLDHIRKERCDVADVSFTLLVGRKHHAHRFATVVNSIEELIEDLEAFGSAGAPPVAADDKTSTRLVFTFSGDLNISAEQVELCCRQAPAFRQYFEACSHALGKNEPSPQFRKFAFQYSFFKLLEAKGIRGNTFIKEGIGTLSVAAISQAATLEQCVERLAEFPGADAAAAGDRDRRLVEKFGNDAVVFAEIGPAGNILKSIPSSGYDVKVSKVNLRMGDKDVLLTYIKGLYLAGYGTDLRWAKEWVSGRRIELPAYEFDRVRCWIREEIPFFDAYLRMPVWRPNEEPLQKKDTGKLIVLTSGVSGEGLVEALAQQAKDAVFFTVRPGVPEDHLAVKEIALEGRNIVHLVGSLSALAETVTLFEDVLRSGNVRYTAVTFDCMKTTTGRGPGDPAMAMCHGFMVGVKEKFPLAEVNCIDIDQASVERFAGELVNGLVSTGTAVSFVYREGKRFVQDMTALTSRDDAAAIRINTGESYLALGAGEHVNAYVRAYIRAKKIGLIHPDSGDSGSHGDRVSGILVLDPARQEAPGQVLSLLARLKGTIRQLVIFNPYNPQKHTGAMTVDAPADGFWQELANQQTGEMPRIACLRIPHPDEDGKDIPDRIVMDLIDSALGTGLSNVIISPPVKQQIPGAMDIREDTAAGSKMQSGPVTKEQIRIALEKIWYDVLKKERIGQDEDFFEIGGHSLNGAQVISRVRLEFQVELEFEDMLEYGTIRSLAECIHDKLPPAAGAQAQANEIVPVAKQAYYEVSAAQRRFWVLQQLGKDPSAYNMSASYEFKGDLDIPSFRRAILSLVERHESLRTTFNEIDGALVQCVLDAGAFGFELNVNSELKDNPAYAQILLDRIRTAAAAPFDLGKAPLIRAALYQIAGDKFVFFFTVHHIIGDGWSLKVMVKDLLTLYQSFSGGLPSPLPPLRVQCKDIVAWQNRQFSAQAFEAHRLYWTEQFAGGALDLEFPVDHPGYKNGAGAGARLRFKLTREHSRALRELTKQNQATPFITLLAAIKLLLYCRTLKEDITVGTPVAGRNHPDMEDQVGLYLNTLPIRTRFKPYETCGSLLGSVKKNALDALKYQEYPIDRIITDLDLPLSSRGNGLFDVGFTFNNYDEPGDPGGAAWQHISVENLYPEITSVKAAIWFHGFENSDEIGFNIDYDAQLFKKTTMDRLMLDFQFILRSLPEILPVEIGKVVDLISENESTALKSQQEDIKRRNALSLKKI
ncbi:condensation domain-containing protein [Flavitalea sp. BT771]|uniref:condensation domain-containing protein n=1 Tax=Flavitalea sp. BT771 TaxID=3063329 RepID=UPI0026E3AE3E|nr:condensation domain-containing protein [Flavitalea sp. BT771]MDO6435719.1 condensation domain-containing protein [Flavitalea sp. BT771]MDV6224630.1 condensation domain-containing protein [Flavitalea sp. BT771]